MEIARKRAGKALIAFLMLMAALTLLSNTLQEMVIPVVEVTTPQRGALEHRVDKDGTLAASGTVPVTSEEAARVTEIIAKVGQKVRAGDPLLRLDYTSVLQERHETLIEALNTMSEKQQAYDWASADTSEYSQDLLEDRRGYLRKAEEKRDQAQKALDELTKEGADEAAIKKARSKLEDAQDSVDYRKDSLEELTSSRDFITAGKEMVQAAEALDAAWRDYFEAYHKLDDATKMDQEKMRADALRLVAYGGSAVDLIPFDPGLPHPGTMRAPLDGEVLTVDAKVGELLSTTAPAFTLGDLRKGLSLTVSVDEDDAEWMAVGDGAEVQVGDERLDCPIVSISASKDDPDQYEVELAIPEGYGSIGLRGSMRFSKKTASYDVLIPLGALREDSQGEFVYVVEQQQGSLGSSMKVKRVDVYSLDKDATRAALQGGLSQREVLVLRSDRALTDGDCVRLEEE